MPTAPSPCVPQTALDSTEARCATWCKDDKKHNTHCALCKCRACEFCGGSSRPLPVCWNEHAPGMVAGGSMESDFCPVWPPYEVADDAGGRLAGAVRATLRPFGASILAEQIDAALEKKCAQKLCVRVQISDGKIYVVAPRSRTCRDGPDSPCTPEARAATPGATSPGTNFSAEFNPTLLEWDFSAGLNVSSCAAAIVDGDFNGPFTRTRWLTALRLLEEAARHEPALHTEFVLCANETPLNAGGWCLEGPQPVFAPTSNEEHPLIAFPHWMPKLRDYDFSVWDAARAVQRRRADAVARVTPDTRRAAAVYRGGVYRLNVYSDEWRTHGVRRTDVNRSTWRHVGRTALLNARAHDKKGYLNVSLPRIKQMQRYLRIPNATLEAMDKPEKLAWHAQQAGFRYVLNIEGHGGWADRLYQLLLSPMLVIAQDLPSRLWYEGVLSPGVTHLAVDSNLRNISEAVRWANAHPKQVRAMVAAANEAMEAATSVAGIRFYVRELLRQYSARLGYRPRPHPRAVQFRCAPTGETVGCEVPFSHDGLERRIHGEACSFVVPGGGGRTAHTLHEAAQFLR